MDNSHAFLIYPHGHTFRFRSDPRNAGLWLQSLCKKPKGCRDFSLHSSKLLSFVLFLLLFFQCEARHSSWDGVVITQADYQGLRAIKHELIDFSGVLRSWNDTGYGACSGDWEGIKCVKGQVIGIQLPYKGLGGRISEKISQLQALRKLSLHHNFLAGNVPLSLGFLPKLRGVYLFNNRLSGTIPPSIGNCPGLQHLDLSNNQLIGGIPPSLANSTKLYRLNLSFNSLSGSIPVSLTRNPSLTILALQHNNLSGSIPDSWGATRDGVYQLQTMRLDHNFLSGTIPTSLRRLGSLEELSLDHNQLFGFIPTELGELARLQKLDLSNNYINGSFPASFCNLSSLVFLDLEHNHLGNELPEAVNYLQNLEVINLRDNQFQGQIPESFGNISGMNQIDLSRNSFTGGIPTSIANLANLTYFNVSYNNLSGAVPTPLSRKFNSSSFAGNLQLCGYSVSTPCSSPPPLNLPPPPQGSPSHHRGLKLSTKDIILIAAGALLVVLLLLCCILLICLMKKKAALKEKSPTKQAPIGSTEKSAAAITKVESGETGGKLVHFDGPFLFTADDLLCATAEILGKSAYGTTYKATLEDGNQVAVKRLREKTTRGQKDFETEVAALGKIRHPNLLALRAYYLGPKGEKLLVFDYMSRGSLASFLHARGPETTISWPERMNIALGVSRGLNHLHTQEIIIHGNLTSSNILLDEQNNAHVADYGLSKLMTTAASTNMVATSGTVGYSAPELSKTKKPTTKTDVYSLGVIMLELLTGKSPREGQNGENLPQWVASIVKEEWTNEVFDLELMKDTTSIGDDELLNTLKLALHCVDPCPEARPEVQQVLEKLEEFTAQPTTSSADDGAKVPSSE